MQLCDIKVGSVGSQCEVAVGHRYRLILWNVTPAKALQLRCLCLLLEELLKASGPAEGDKCGSDSLARVLLSLTS